LGQLWGKIKKIYKRPVIFSEVKASEKNPLGGRRNHPTRSQWRCIEKIKGGPGEYVPNNDAPKTVDDCQARVIRSQFSLPPTRLNGFCSELVIFSAEGYSEKDRAIILFHFLHQQHMEGLWVSLRPASISKFLGQIFYCLFLLRGLL
jgi:hypothetical protein